ncbi:MAG: DUF805 domain-containing protein [Anaerotignum sp.]|nr:DUF805 domain-containing protein [Anaerotignum sp.]
MNSYIAVIKKYAVFTGRESRKNFWYFALFNFIIGIVLSILDAIFGTHDLLLAIYSLAIILPGIGVSIRRLHDINKSGWWYFIPLLPIAGGIWLFILLATAGTPGENKYGEPVINEL